MKDYIRESKEIPAKDKYRDEADLYRLYVLNYIKPKKEK